MQPKHDCFPFTGLYYYSDTDSISQQIISYFQTFGI